MALALPRTLKYLIQVKSKMQMKLNLASMFVLAMSVGCGSVWAKTVQQLPTLLPQPQLPL